MRRTAISSKMPESGEKRMQYIFVHGLSGWGSYDAAYRRMPYWGIAAGT